MNVKTSGDRPGDARWCAWAFLDLFMMFIAETHWKTQNTEQRPKHVRGD